MSATIFEDQRLDLTLNCKDDTGAVLNLTGETGNVRLLVQRPDGSEDTVTPTITDAANGVIDYTFPVNYLRPSGRWNVKGYLNTQQIPGTIYSFVVYERWLK